MKKIVVCRSSEYAPVSVDGQAVNPRRHTKSSVSKMRRSLEADGLYKPLPISKDDDRLIGGHLRAKVINELISEGYSLVFDNGEEAPGIPVVRATFDGDRDRIYRDRDNSHDGDWDYSILATEAKSLLDSFDSSDIELTGFNEDQWKSLNSDFDTMLQKAKDDSGLEGLSEEIDLDEEKPATARLSFKVKPEEKDLFVRAMGLFHGDSDGERISRMADFCIMKMED